MVAFTCKDGLTTESLFERMDQIEIIKRLNANAIRMHKPCQKMMMALCGEQGIFVLTEIPAWQNSNHLLEPALADQMRDQLRQLINRDMNHPSALIWSLGNEWTPSKNEEDIHKAYTAVKSLIEFAREADPSGNRFVSCVTGGAQIHP